ncbi:Sec14 cytosolic factor [Nannizzia gypsea CBS 118893]|uniref:Sec14 cytosolic factor n=1 Tax=Arthroderma gypseum (strain ATCC MYA-4604 / CBS 118893) TaxID=535722 RepID=E5R0R3_ARTGP|nr:Sec14 cytosolic factor [Nannizzia gypsea CBS 118893]EFQ97569.1 Sec14 cytosolic factor [Nannizzia gypsea CBS 118893]
MAAKEPQPKDLPIDPKYDHYDFPTSAPTPQAGHPGYTTPEQDAQVFQLRKQLEDAGCKDRLDTLTLLRFLRARKFNIEASKAMFLACEKWRTEFKTNTLVADFDYPEKEKMFEFYPQFYHKTDKDGRPVYIEQFGKINLDAMYKITTSDRMLKHLVCEYEKLADNRLPACARKSGHLLETCCTIMDMKGVGLSNASSVIGYVRQASAISQNYYPERLGKLYIINAPWGFSTVFGMVKGFLDPVTVKKIAVLGSGYESELLSQIPAENLPVQFGGKCECEGGCMLSDMGPWQEPEWLTPQEKKTEQVKTEVVKEEAKKEAGEEEKKDGEDEGEKKEGEKEKVVDPAAAEGAAPAATTTAPAPAPAPAPAAA